MNHEELTQQIEKFAAIATRGCGQSDIVWANLFQANFDGWVESLSVEDTETAITIAKQLDYYCDDDGELGDDYCCHGLTSDTCPCGCFEGNDESETEFWENYIARLEAMQNADYMRDREKRINA